MHGICHHDLDRSGTKEVFLKSCTTSVGIQSIWRAGGNDYISIATQNTSVMAERVVDLIEESMLQLFSRGARRCAGMYLQSCERH